MTGDLATIAREWQELRPAGGFDLIMADPPWSFSTWSDKGHGKSAQRHYTCRSAEWVRGLPVAEVLAGPNCLLWLWATNPMLPAAFDVLEAWGFQFRTAGHWAKRTRHGKLAFGTGYILRCAGEPFLIGVRGKVKTTRSVRSVIEGQIREHSRKPDEAFREAERLMPEAQRIEVFSRQARPGWSVWGDEVTRFAEACHG
ncbi:DNA methyltransferase [Cereibacter sphaeroides]|uniref:MT-A70 family methyltransferase n=1 Tax=Cereibacter sphaeroides TaxID=1063 RepID=UPI000F53CD3A|nr:MT-A70 family methyltransferase [Cereibacter sphaeroides]AZB63900.1 DNA methyltransferase [Cereibacter sphaeroides]AZB68178.1 DNA methyltransferase [Cereibacter sphaeroides]